MIYLFSLLLLLIIMTSFIELKERRGGGSDNDNAKPLLQDYKAADDAEGKDVRTIIEETIKSIEIPEIEHLSSVLFKATG